MDRKHPMARTFISLAALLTLALGSSIGMAEPGASVTAEPNTDALLACQKIAESSQRLACFDAESAKLGAALSRKDVVVVSRNEVKAAQKAGRKRKSNRKPSGFVKPTLISTELAGFLGKPKGTEMARTEVTREINKYIRANNLQDPSNGRVIRADAKLRKLLKLNKSDELTYFNLQKYMSPHFPKPTTTTA